MAKHHHAATATGGGTAAGDPHDSGDHRQIGALFGLPGVTRPTEQVENNDQTVVTLSQTAQVGANFAANFMQSDIVVGWDLEVNVAQTIAAGGGTITSSAYFPYQVLASVRLNMQNQFDTISYNDGGIDAMIFQTIRPRYDNQMLNVVQQNTISSGYSAQTNLDTASNYTSGSANLKFTIQLAPAIHFDKYWELDEKGEPRHRQPLADVVVSPQLMSGTNRIVQPKVRFNPFFASVSDGGPYTTAGGAPTASGSATLGFTRYGFYQPVGPEDTPLLFDWQYTRETTRFTLGAINKITLPVPLDGQILSLFVRLFDPAASGGVGAPIVLSTAVKYCRLLYGSGLIRFDDTPQRMQRRLVEQRQFLPPEGVIIWDLAYQYGDVTNRYAINTMNTTNITVYLEFNSALSGSAYAVMGVEALRYVARM